MDPPILLVGVVLAPDMIRKVENIASLKTDRPKNTSEGVSVLATPPTATLGGEESLGIIEAREASYGTTRFAFINLNTTRPPGVFQRRYRGGDSLGLCGE